MAKTIIICITALLSLIIITVAGLVLKYEQAGYITFDIRMNYSNYTESENGSFETVKGI